MKLFKILSHPYTLIFCFLFILISGEHWGGFYVTYLLTALPFGRLQSLLGVSGILVLILSYHRYYKVSNKVMSGLMNMLGVLLLLASVVVFFKRDVAHYNWGTFDQAVPMFTIYLTSFVALCFLAGTFWRAVSKSSDKRSLLSKV